jgi:hypothetical protein
MPPSVPAHRSAKKPYDPPRLEVYGDIRDVTRGNGHSSLHLDSAASHSKKTS